MATRDLINLIKCSGYAGTSGQSFRNHVTGAASGVKMSDYNLTGWNFSGGPGSGVSYADGQVFNLTGNLLGGAKCGLVAKQGSGLLTLTYSANSGGLATLTSSSVSGSGVAADITVRSPYNAGAVAGMSGSATWYYGGSDQSGPPSSGYCQAHFSARVTGSGGIGDGLAENMTFTLSFPNVNAGTGLFNPDPTPIVFTASMFHRGIPYTDFTVEWHSNSSYTALVSGSPDYYPDESVFAPSSPPNPYSLWLRYKAPGSPTWTNYGQVDFNDTRIIY